MFSILIANTTAQQPNIWVSSLPWIFLIFLFYFMVLRPKQKEEKRRIQMINELKKGDKVMTISGIAGKVSKVGDTFITLEIANNVQVEFHRNAITTKLDA